MKTIILTLLVVCGLTSCVTNKRYGCIKFREKVKVVTTPVANSNKLMVLPYEDYFFNGVKMMNTGDTLYLDPVDAYKN